MHTKTIISLILLFIIFLVGWNSIYVIDATQRGILLQFGEAVEIDIEPGIGFKIPIIHDLRKFDIRKLLSDLDEETYLTKDKEPLVVDSYVIWRIKDLRKFYVSTTGNINKAEILLKPRIDKELRNKFGLNTQKDLISTKRDNLTKDVTKQVDKFSQTDLGIEIVDIRIRKIEYDPNILQQVYNKMKAERNQVAQLYRAEGKEQAKIITAEADKNVQIIKAEANQKAEVIRGEGDAQATNIYANAYNRDQEFYAFYRSLNAYKQTLNDKSDILLLKPDSQFFQYLNQDQGQTK